MAVGEYMRPRRPGQTCAQCALVFDADRKKKYCSKKCSWMAHARKVGVRPLAVERALRRNPLSYFTCEWCGTASHRSLSGKENREGKRPRWCSLTCLTAQKLADRQRRREVEAMVSMRRGVVMMLRRVFDRAKTRQSKARSCFECGIQFTLWRGHGGWCSEECRLLRSKRLTKASPAYRANKGAWRKADKCRRKGARTERFNPIEVLARDGWRCQLCGVKTPPNLRGTCHPNAPELDHIIPISKGGDHSRLNTQCACRACNGSKANRPMGQLRLVA